MNLLRHVQVMNVSSEAGIVTQSTKYTHHIDMSGWEGVMFIAVGTSDTKRASTKTFMRIQGCSSTALGSFTNYKGGSSNPTGSSFSAVVNPGGTALTLGSSLAKSIPFVVDIYKPLKRYIRASAHGFSTGPLVIIAMTYGPRRPGTSDSMWTSTFGNPWGSTVLISPTTG